MEKKNMVLLTVIAIATLLVAVVGATFAYFTATVTDNRGSSGSEGQAAVKAAQTPGNLIIEQSATGFASFNDTNVYPGHKDLIQVAVTSAATNTTDTYFNIVYTGTNTFPSNRITFDIYESLENITVSTQNAFTCTQKSEAINATQYKLYETCALNGALATTSEKTHKINSVPLQQNQGRVIINGQHPFLITGNSNKRTVYYYIVATYTNDTTKDQGTGEQGASFNGKISVEIAGKDNQAIADDSSHLTTKNA